MPTWLLILLIIIILPYLAAPIIIRYTQKFSVASSLRQLFSDFLPTPVKNAFQDIGSALYQENFIHCYDAVSYNDAQSLRLFFRTFSHPTKEVFAIATAWVYEGLADSKVMPSLEFISHFNDDFKLTTHNSDLTSAPLRAPKDILNTLTLIKNPGQLFRVHLFYLKQMAKKRTVLFLEHGQGLSFLEKSLEAELTAQADMGGLFLEKSSQQYRPTWAGAILMAWYNMWPIVLLRRLYHRLHAKLWLKRLSSAKPTVG